VNRAGSGGGLFRSGPKVSAADRVRDYARAQVRAGLLDPAGVQREVTDAVAAERDVPDASAVAVALVEQAHDDLVAEARGWPERTDHDRLQAAFGDLAVDDVIVLQGVDDHWAAQAVLRQGANEGRLPAGVVWFTPPDVWHAVDHGMLELNVWHGDSANVQAGDPLLDLVIGRLAGHGLAAHFDEGRVEVAAFWQSRAALGRHLPPT